MTEYTYERAQKRWRRSETIEILSGRDTQIALFPLSFVALGGDNTWSYILDTIQQLVEVAAGGAGVIMDEQNRIVDGDQPVYGGVFRYSQLGVDFEPNFSRGPEYYSHFKKPTLTSSETTRSASSRLTGRPEQSRPDLYQTVLGEKHPNMFSPEAGLLLSGDLHRAFDRLEWSLYRKEDTYYVHYFIPLTPEQFKFHGKCLAPERFSRFVDPPDPRLVAWHYNQAIKARIRGFSAGMNASGADAVSV